MAKPNYRAEASTAVAKSWSHTKVKIIKVRHTWTISNFSFLAEALNSSKFSAEGYDRIKWYLRLYHQGASKESEDYVSLFLHLDSEGEIDVRAKLSFSILNAKQEKIRAIQSKKLLKFDRKINGYGHQKFVQRDQLLKCLEKSSIDDLTVCCEVSFAVDTVQIPSQSCPIKTKVAECVSSGVLSEKEGFSEEKPDDQSGATVSNAASMTSKANSNQPKHVGAKELGSSLASCKSALSESKSGGPAEEKKNRVTEDCSCLKCFFLEDLLCANSMPSLGTIIFL